MSSKLPSCAALAATILAAAPAHADQRAAEGCEMVETVSDARGVKPPRPFIDELVHEPNPEPNL